MNENMNTDNLLEDDAVKAENSVTPQVDDTVADDFFTQLDKQVMGETLDQPKVEMQEEVVQQPQVEQQVAPEMDATNLEKRYSDSSREQRDLILNCKRLNLICLY